MEVKHDPRSDQTFVKLYYDINMPKSRSYFDPELTAEAKMRRMREEMYTLRQTVISLVPQAYQSLIQPPYDFTQKESRMWLNILSAARLRRNKRIDDIN